MNDHSFAEGLGMERARQSQHDWLPDGPFYNDGNKWNALSTEEAVTSCSILFFKQLLIFSSINTPIIWRIPITQSSGAYWPWFPLFFLPPSSLSSPISYGATGVDSPSSSCWRCTFGAPLATFFGKYSLLQQVKNNRSRLHIEGTTGYFYLPSGYKILSLKMPSPQISRSESVVSINSTGCWFNRIIAQV